MTPKSQKNIKILRIFLPLFLLGAAAFSSFSASAAGMGKSDVLEFMNKDRVEAGLKALGGNEALDRAAEAKAEDMLKNDYFAHTSPEGRTPWHWLKKAGYSYKYAGENLATNYTDAKDQEKAWMKSKTHRENILNKNYREAGIAIVDGKIDGQSSLVTVVFFGAPPLAAAAKEKAAPAAEKTAPLAHEAKGTEAAEPVPDLETSPSPFQMPVLVPLPEVVKEHPAPLSLALSFIVIALTLLSSPTAFLVRAYLALSATRLKKTLPTVPSRALMVLSEQSTGQRFLRDILPHRQFKPP